MSGGAYALGKLHRPVSQWGLTAAQGGVVTVSKRDDGRCRHMKCTQKLLESNICCVACLQIEGKPSLERALVYCFVGWVLLEISQHCGITV